MSGKFTHKIGDFKAVDGGISPLIPIGCPSFDWDEGRTIFSLSSTNRSTFVDPYFAECQTDARNQTRKFFWTPR